MTIDRLKADVGEELYSQACLEAWKAAPDTGSWEAWRSPVATTALDVVLDRADSDGFTDDGDGAFMAFFTDLYRDMPSYSLLFTLFINRSYEDLDNEARQLFWKFAREMLSSEHAALADPIGYYMWCHFFEDKNVEEAWRTLTIGAPDRLLERVFIHSGPVPFHIKRELYRQKLGNKRWHYFIYRGLLHSAFDVYGRIERTEARRILEKLKLSLPKQEHENLERLRQRLAG